MMKVGLMSAASSIKADLLTEKFISPYGFVSGNMASKKSSTKTESFLELWRRCKLANPPSPYLSQYLRCSRHMVGDDTEASA